MTTADDAMTPWRTPPLAAGHAEQVLEQAYAEELEQLRRDAHQQGLAEGRKQGEAEARSEAEALLGQLEAILNALQQPFNEVNDDVVEELARLAGHIATQLLRRELKTSPEAIIGVIREAIGSLPDDREGAKVYLNPEDVRLVTEMSQKAKQERHWELLSDPAVNRGDCIVLRGAALVDATLEKRASAAMLELLGGERSEDTTA